MNIAITGASGHIGNTLVRELIKQNAHIKALVHSFKNNLDTLGVELIHGSLQNTKSLDKLCEDVDYVFHLAAKISIDNRNAKAVYNTNIQGTKNILEAAKKAGVKKFIHFSSIDAFQIDDPMLEVNEEHALATSKGWVYQYSKAESERLVLQAVKQGLNAVILSPTAVIGPNDYKNSYLGQALQRIYKNKIPFIISGGYNWVDVRDIVQASIEAINSGRRGQKYLLSGNYRSLVDLSNVICDLSGGHKLLLIPTFLAKISSPLLQLVSYITKKDPLYTKHSIDLLEKSPKVISSDKAKKELKYTSRNFEETVIDTINWYKQNNYLNGTP